VEQPPKQRFNVAVHENRLPDAPSSARHEPYENGNLEAGPSIARTGYPLVVIGSILIVNRPRNSDTQWSSQPRVVRPADRSPSPPYFEGCNCEPFCPCRSVHGRPGGPSTYGGLLRRGVLAGTAVTAAASRSPAARWCSHFGTPTTWTPARRGGSCSTSTTARTRPRPRLWSNISLGRAGAHCRTALRPRHRRGPRSPARSDHPRASRPAKANRRRGLPQGGGRGGSLERGGCLVRDPRVRPPRHRALRRGPAVHRPGVDLGGGRPPTRVVHHRLRLPIRVEPRNLTARSGR
jgi:hypothetical protein